MNLPQQLPLVSPYIKTAFLLAKTKYQLENAAWTNLSGVLAGRFSLPIAMINFQRQSDLDLLLRCMEDECEANNAAEALGTDFALHYQLMLSETWAVACYEILVSEMTKAILATMLFPVWQHSSRYLRIWDSCGCPLRNMKSQRKER